MKLVSIFASLLICSQVVAQVNQPQLINWFVGADVVGVSNSEKDLPNDFSVREFEISAFSNIDHIWQGNLTLSMHNDIGSNEEAHVDIHEAFIFSNQAIEGMNLKFGRFFLGFGRLNRFHRHDWAIAYAPMYHQEFFGEEAVKDDGAEVSKLLLDDFYLNLTVGITTGKTFKDQHDHDHEEEAEEEERVNALTPTHYARLSSFTEFSTQAGLEYGLNYIGRIDPEKNSFQYAGFDLIFKNRINRYFQDLFQMEIWQRNQKEAGEASYAQDLGAYAFYQRGFDQNHALGLRIDWYKPHNHEEEEAESGHDHGTEIDDEYTEIGLVYSYTNSEFMRTNITLAQSQGLIIDEEEVTNTKLFLQTVFTIGAHPAHLY